jgi:predicted peptidase
MKKSAICVLSLAASILLLAAMSTPGAAAAARRRGRPTRRGANANRPSPDWIKLYEPAIHNADSADKKMPYRLMKPLGFDKSKSYPVIVSLHGGGGRGDDNRKQLKDWNKQLADKKARTDHPCYVLAPQSKGLWNKTHLENIQSIIKALPSVDSGRIYILGHSMGGHGTYILIQLAPNYFAAAAPSAGSGLRRTEKFIDASVIKNIPIWAFHGDKDGVCPFEKDQKVFDELKKLGGNMKLTKWKGDNHGVSGKFIPGAENGETQMTGNRCDPEPVFLKWLFKQKRPEKQKKQSTTKPAATDRLAA